MNEKIILDMLKQDSVSLVRQKYTIIDGVEYNIGEQWRRAYINSIQGRVDVELEVIEPYKSAIFSVWGNEPTVFPSEI